ncbi:LmeA family phospholipid-binding protein [Mycolicibacterium psychrotolerans]|uniref:LmeA family phospholipid-binding protein n=1 Tax=Mycolicibacterium psychrotolerans TaxID=216929 RepID=UPI003D668F87
MTNPPQGPNHPVGPGDPTTPAWAASPGQGTPTEYIPRPGGPADAPTQHIPHVPPPSQTPPGEEPEEGKRGFLRDPLSIVLVLVIVLAVVIAGLLGTELYVRHEADTVVSRAVSCVVQDQADVSFGARPFLLQHLSKHYSDIHVQTAGNQIRGAKGMKLDLWLDDIRIDQTANSAGTMGSLDATIAWTKDGIKETVQNAIPFFGSLVSSVSTSPSDGTIELQSAMGSITTKPAISNGGLTLQVVNLTGLGFTLPRETVQPALDAFMSTLTKNLPMGIHADSVAVTDEGVTAKFVTQNATIPNGQQDPCFAGV